jgi:hypothetical protein
MCTLAFPDLLSVASITLFILIPAVVINRRADNAIQNLTLLLPR